jgi:hypothetical protein
MTSPSTDIYTNEIYQIYTQRRREELEHEQLQREEMPLRPNTIIKTNWLNPFVSADYINSQQSWRDQPVWSAFVPVALTEGIEENFDNIITTINEISKASRKTAAPVEVTLWANSKLGTTGVVDADLELLNRQNIVYEQFVRNCKEAFGRLDGRVRIRSTHNFFEPNHGMNEIRATGTYHIAFEALIRQFDLKHPISYIDADLTVMDSNTVINALTKLKAGDAHFVHTNLIYTGEAISGFKHPALSGKSKAEKVAGIYAIARGMLEQNLGPTEDHGYVEEPGLFFTLQTYLESGGIGTLNPKHGETRTLLRQAKKYLSPKIPLVYYVKNARMGISYRRFAHLAEIRPAWELAGSEEDDEYEEFTVMQRLHGPQPKIVITEDAVRKMIDKLENIQIERLGSTKKGFKPEQRKRLEAIIARAAFVAY